LQLIFTGNSGKKRLHICCEAFKIKVEMDPTGWEAAGNQIARAYLFSNRQSSHQTVLLLHGAMSLTGVFLAPKQSSGS